jgi:serine protease AprX
MVLNRLRIFTFMVVPFILSGIQASAGEARYWVFFRDKGVRSLEKTTESAQAARLGISETALKIRRKAREAGRIFDSSDLPVESAYVEALSRAGFTVRMRSRWLNAAVVLTDETRCRELSAFPFVNRIRPVVSFRGRLPEKGKPLPRRPGKRISGLYDYGSSEAQVAQIHVPEVHALGLTGTGIRIGMLDAGFDVGSRRAFRNTDIVAQRSFIDPGLLSDSSRADTLSQRNHGTETFSVIGGFDEGELIGPAFGASFALAETEWVSSETRIEEDWWVAGIEWLVDSIGVDVVSTSLGYNTFDNGTGYAYEDMDGRTCVTTRAANMAADRGVTVCASAGNEARTGWRGVLSPADGIGVLAVGAVSLEGARANFSSGGPTFDGRIKPDVSAMGVGVYMINPDRLDVSRYLFASGTSFSCPLTAGVCALVLEGHPELRPEEVREALRMTASRSAEPDTLLGWGIVNAFEAVFYHGMIFRNFSVIQFSQESRYGFQFEILARGGLKSDSVWVEYNAGISGSGRIFAARIPDPSRFLYEVRFPVNLDSRKIHFFIQAGDSSGRTYRSPGRAPDEMYALSDWVKSPPQDSLSAGVRFRLRQNYPNPFREKTWIEMDVLQAAGFKIDVFDLLGRRVDAFDAGVLQEGRVRLEWNAREVAGGVLPSGIYCFRINSGGQTQVIKIAYIK